MSFSDWVSESTRRISNYGVSTGVRCAIETLATGVYCRAGQYINYGENIYTRDWDVLILLDTCRPDAVEAVQSEYGFFTDERSPPTHTSVGSASKEWVEKTFSDPQFQDDIAETAYVTANLFSERVPDNSVQYLDEVWKYGWDKSKSTTPPAVVADRAVSVWRNQNPDQMIVHFMQPHTPHPSLYDRYPEWQDESKTSQTDTRTDSDDSSSPRISVEQPPENNPSRETLATGAHQFWEDLRTGELSKQDGWNAYLDTLRWVLDDGVKLLSKNLDADSVIISADHCDAFGEYGVYAHPPYAPVPVLKQVPWVEIKARDTNEYTPSIKPDNASNLTNEETTKRLRSLGYL